MQKRGLSGIITLVLLILLVLIAIGIIWLSIRPAITNIVGDQNSDGEISRLTSCLDIQLDSDCEILENGNYQVKVRRSADEANIQEIVFRFKTDNEEFTLKNETLVPGRFGSATYILNLSSETSEEARTVEVAAILENENACEFQSLSSCSQQTIGGGNQNFEPLSTYALSWDGSPKDNLIPMYQLRLNDAPSKAIAFTDQQPSGFKTIIDRSRFQGINTNESDRCQDPLSLSDYDCVWWDNGVEDVKNKYDSFLSQYQQQGGDLDYWILDTETLLSNWAIGSNLNDPGQLARWRAIQNDPRNVTLFNELRSIGPFQGEDLIGTVYNWSKGGDNYLIWNALMQKRTADYYNQATYDKVRQYYPEVKSSNYGFNHWSQDYHVPEMNGHRQYLYTSGSHAGTHQTEEGMYGELGQITNPNRLIPGFTYEKTPFNAFRYEVNRMRSMQLSSSIEVQPWVSWKGWNKSSIYDNDYYEELMIHLAMSDPDVILFWNPYTAGETPPSNDANDTLLSNILLETDQFIGYENRDPITYNFEQYSDEEWWMSDYVLSGMKAADKKIWRFTPDISTPYTLLAQENPVIIETQLYRITFPEGSIEPNNVSTIGYWIIQPEIALDPIISQL